MDQNLQVSSIVMELGGNNLLAYYAESIGEQSDDELLTSDEPNNAELLTNILISAAEALDQFHKRIF
ncbi:unnamed protein product [Meloidogyne enterolobii]|uniref:Uncharacterized protein n=1 Tax=Meloidogyne enterolobii TaxID=390850 RepID=A0ACB0ZPB1_MELEN